MKHLITKKSDGATKAVVTTEELLEAAVDGKYDVGQNVIIIGGEQYDVTTLTGPGQLTVTSASSTANSVTVDGDLTELLSAGSLVAVATGSNAFNLRAVASVSYDDGEDATTAVLTNGSVAGTEDALYFWG